MSDLTLDPLEVRSPIAEGDVQFSNGSKITVTSGLTPVWQRRFKNLWDYVQRNSSGGALGQLGLRSTRIHISADQLLNPPYVNPGDGSMPALAILPAPGAGRLIVPVMAYAIMRDGTPFGLNDSPIMQWGELAGGGSAVSAPVGVGLNFFLAEASVPDNRVACFATGFLFFIANTIAPDSTFNQPLRIYTDQDTSPGGTRSIDLHVSYYVLDLSASF